MKKSGYVFAEKPGDSLLGHYVRNI